jgi:hypothetical protein
LNFHQVGYLSQRVPIDENDVRNLTRLDRPFPFHYIIHIEFAASVVRGCIDAQCRDTK